jgi:hypothetical protein
MIKLYNKSKDKQFIIEQDDPEVGFYLYVYENEKCIADYLQDDLEAIIQQAYQDFKLDPQSWKNKETQKH